MPVGDTIYVQPMTSDILLNACQSFEEQYSLSSADFFSRYLKGQFVGIHDAARWAGYWRAYLREVVGRPRPGPHKEPSQELAEALS